MTLYAVLRLSDRQVRRVMPTRAREAHSAACGESQGMF
jgi:hypothetical protein